jgi:excisionase family DNA binding protein
MTLLNKKAAADALGVSTATLDRLRRSGRLPYRKVGGLIRFLPEDIESFVRMSIVPGKARDTAESHKIGNHSDAVRLIKETLEAAEAGDLPFVISAVKALQDAVNRYILS